MSNSASTDSSSVESSFTQFEQIRSAVELEFEVEENLIEYGIPTFYLKLKQDSKNAFLRLIKRLEPLGFVPLLRRKEDKTVLQVAPKPPVKPSKPEINVALFLATIGTTLIAGYIFSLGLVEEGYMQNPMLGAITFAAAIMAIFGAHEMGHKVVANMHGIEATAPYFIPGPPWPFGFGTFGAVIQQKSLAPNKDALFDLGASGPIVGFVVSIIVTIIGIRMSYPSWVNELPQGTVYMPIIYELIAMAFLKNPQNTTNAKWLLVTPHPVALAGWVGMLVTMLNLIPTGMFDGGHAARGSLGPRTRSILSAIAIAILFILGYYMFAVFALFLSLGQHPGPLDDVSKLTNGRKLATIALISIFVLCVAPL
jgi:membrane-associated protease RseP (regulator of RpoE activity)